MEELTGGGGLALLLAAGIESGAVAGLARVLGREVKALEPHPAAPPEPAGRDENGRFTAEYKQARLAEVAADEPDPRFRSVTELRPDKDLSRLSLGKMSRSSSVRAISYARGKCGSTMSPSQKVQPACRESARSAGHP